MLPANANLSFKTKLNCLFFQGVFQPYPVSYTLASLHFRIPRYQTYHAEWGFLSVPLLDRQLTVGPFVFPVELLSPSTMYIVHR